MASRASGRSRSPAVRMDSSRHVATEIRRDIQRKGLKPGDRIGTEQELAAQFGVSRPTLREGLRLLSSSHLIRSSQGRGGGIFVASTPNEGIGRSLSDSIATLLATDGVSLGGLLEARMVLEVPIAGLAAAAASSEVADALDDAIARADRSEPGQPAFNAADYDFHDTLARATGNDLLVALTRWVSDVFQPSLIRRVGSRTSKGEILGQHAAIAAAVRDGNVADAELSMRRHLEYLVDVLRDNDASGDSR